MTRSEALPSSGALEEVRRLADPSAVILGAARLVGGQHANTWRVDTEQIADDFLAAYEAATGQAVGEMRLWDTWAVARSDDAVGPGPRTTCRWAALTR
jgi:hypothetical protein